MYIQEIKTYLKNNNNTRINKEEETQQKMVWETTCEVLSGTFLSDIYNGPGAPLQEHMNHCSQHVQIFVQLILIDFCNTYMILKHTFI